MTEQRHVNSILVAASGFIYAPNSSNNLGDRAQLTRSVERLRAAFPESRLVAVANSLNDTGSFDDVEVSYAAIRYLTAPARVPVIGLSIPTGVTRTLRALFLLGNARRIRNGNKPILLVKAGRVALEEMQESSALFISGAGTFNDLYVSSVGGFWGTLARCMSALGKPVVASGQQVGPLERIGRRALVKWAVRPIDLLGVRDPQSAASALAVDIPKQRLVLTGDDAWELAPAAAGVADAILKRQGIPERFIAAQIRFGPSVGWDETDSKSFAVSLDHLSSEVGLPLVFVPCATGLGADDRSAAARVRDHINTASWAIAEELDARTTKAILGKAILGVGTANHFCVFAASMGTPVVGLYASPYMKQKISGIAELWPSRVAAVPKVIGVDPPALLGAAQRLLERQIDNGAASDMGQPSMRVLPDEPIQFLKRLLVAAIPESSLSPGSRSD